MDLILKSTGAPIVLSDVGVIIEPSTGSTFTGIPGLIRILGQSVALRALVAGGSVIVNNGITDLSALAGQQYLNQLWTQAGDGVAVQMANVEGAISDFQHGSKTLGTLHAVATQSVAGFMSSTDKTKLDNLSGTSSKSTVRWVGLGRVTAVTNMDGAWVAPEAGTILRITLHRRVAGTSGSTIVDVNKNQATVFTTQANRPTIAFTDGANAISARTNMDVTAFAQNDQFQVDVDQAEGGNPQDVSIIMEVQFS